eukprot:Clim_evm153s157 gene=Clim_evmTU153s157
MSFQQRGPMKAPPPPLDLQGSGANRPELMRQQSQDGAERAITALAQVAFQESVALVEGRIQFVDRNQVLNQQTNGGPGNANGEEAKPQSTEPSKDSSALLLDVPMADIGLLLNKEQEEELKKEVKRKVTYFDVDIPTHKPFGAFSKKLEKLFALPHVPYLFSFYTPITEGSIQIKLKFKNPYYQHEPVERCEQCSKKEEPQPDAPKHFVTCTADERGESNAEHTITDDGPIVTMRFNLQREVAPRVNTGSGNVHCVQRNLKFGCLNSHLGGKNKRDLEINLSLLSTEGVQLASKTIDLKVCKRPQRDADLEEQGEAMESVDAMGMYGNVPQGQRPPQEEKDKSKEDWHLIKVRDFEDWKLLNQMAEALSFFREHVHNAYSQKLLSGQKGEDQDIGSKRGPPDADGPAAKLRKLSPEENQRTLYEWLERNGLKQLQPVLASNNVHSFDDLWSICASEQVPFLPGDVKQKMKTILEKDNPRADAVRDAFENATRLLLKMEITKVFDLNDSQGNAFKGLQRNAVPTPAAPLSAILPSPARFTTQNADWLLQAGSLDELNVRFANPFSPLITPGLQAELLSGQNHFFGQNSLDMIHQQQQTNERLGIGLNPTHVQQHQEQPTPDIFF